MNTYILSSASIVILFIPEVSPMYYQHYPKSLSIHLHSLTFLIINILEVAVGEYYRSYESNNGVEFLDSHTADHNNVILFNLRLVLPTSVFPSGLSIKVSLPSALVLPLILA